PAFAFLLSFGRMTALRSRTLTGPSPIEPIGTLFSLRKSRRASREPSVLACTRRPPWRPIWIRVCASERTNDSTEGKDEEESGEEGKGREKGEKRKKGSGREGDEDEKEEEGEEGREGRGRG